MYLMHRRGGHAAQESLWKLLDAGRIVLHPYTAPEVPRMRELMRRYRDTPMDLADASLVAAVETLGLDTVLTLDRHFYAYRIHDTRAFTVVP